jgi:hypothetical protein
MRVRLRRRLAERIDGVDLSQHGVGDLINLSRHDGELVIAEGWATPVHSARDSAARGKAAHTTSRPRKRRTR